jgi:hypothetical protein
MPSAAKDHSLLEGVEVGFGRRQVVVETGHFQVEECFRLVASRRKGVERVGKAIVEDRQRLNASGRKAT